MQAYRLLAQAIQTNNQAIGQLKLKIHPPALRDTFSERFKSNATVSP